MARRKTRRAPYRPRRRPRRRQPVLEPREPLLTPETTQTVGGVLLTLAGVVLFLALLGLGGPLGSALAHWAQQVVGAAAWFLAPLGFYFGQLLVRKRPPARHVVVGSLIILVSLAAIFHLFVKTDQLAAGLSGQFGGLVGYALTATTLATVGSLVSWLVFLALLAIGMMVMFNRSPEEKQAGQVATEADVPDREAPTPSPTPPPKPPTRSQQQAPPPDFQPREVDAAWEQPPLSLLNDQIGEASAGDTKQLSQIIETTLANFGITAQVEHVNVGPTVTQYELRPAPGVKVADINQRSNDLALALAAHPIRIEAPIPGKSTVGIEVPNQKPALVRLHQLFSSDIWKKGGALPLALGLDVSGRPVIADLASMPHLLIAGQTGSGKSVSINGLLISLLFTHSPKHLRLLLIDPKRVELSNYNGIPHLLSPVITDSPKVINALKWVVAEMERRYKLFQDRGAKNLVEFNRQHPDETLPYLVIVVDELADLMQVAGKAVEGTITRIAQLARATGIHLVIATQRPSVNVITGVIKANFPSRIAFNVSSQVDSRTILDKAGAEKLLGQGDMLFLPGTAPNPIRVQGAYVETREVKKLTDFLKGKGEPAYDDSITERAQGGSGGESGDFDENGDDPLYEEVKAEVVRTRKASASYLQRRFKVGYSRAARLLDILEENGVIGPGEGAKPRDILVDSEE